MAHVTFPKPLPGEYRTERQRLEREHKYREDKTMAEAKRRDEHKCRVPRCAFRGLRVEAAHERHRGMGGNAAEDRTTLEQLWSLCQTHHAMWDRGQLVIEPQTEQGANAECAYYLRNLETDALTHIGTEKRINVSVERTIR